jgi:dihydrofolate reductase
MGSVLLDVSMSLDGFIAGPDVGQALPMGAGGERLHDWMSAGGVDAQVARDLAASAGAMVMGRRTFDLGEGPWGDTPFPVPCFVLTHQARAELVKASGTFTFVTDGVQAALARARAVAGDKDVCLMGADLLEELHLHLVPVLLGGGTRLFDHLGGPVELERTGLIGTAHATHLRYRVVRAAG